MQADDPAVKRMGYPVVELTLGRVLADKAAKNGERRYLQYLPDGRSYTYRDADRLSNRIAQGFLRRGIGRGTHVAVMMENCPEQLLTFFALGKIGAVAVPINTAARGQLLKYYLEFCDAAALVIEAALVPHYLEIRDGVAAIGTTFVLGAPQAACLDFAELLDAPEERPDIEVKHSDLAFLLYTSGTTGPSKAIMFPHAYALLYGIDQSENYGFRPGDVAHVCLPLFHANGLLSHCYGMLVTDGEVALARRFSASRFWMEVRGSGATVLSLLGSMANILWAQPPRPDDADNQVRQAAIAPVPKDAVAFEKRYGLRLISTYGLTDYGLGCIRDRDAPAAKMHSAGIPRQGMQVKIFDDDDMPLPPGEVGEIVLRSDYAWTTSPGYYKMPEATLAARRNGWFHSGDRGYFDEDGYLYFADRKKDAIRRRGENISAYEVEQAIVSHPAVSDVAAFPVASPLGEDEVACAVVLAEGARLTEAGLIEHCQHNLSYFMVPRYLRFVHDLPRSPTHKIEKYKLQQAAEADLQVYWDREKAGIVLRR